VSVNVDLLTTTGTARKDRTEERPVSVPVTKSAVADKGKAGSGSALGGSIRQAAGVHALDLGV
jgi:hypothetical protein